MRNKIIYLLGGLTLLALTGCIKIAVEIWHNPDGSGRILHQQAFTAAFFEEVGLEGDIEEAKIEFLEEAEIKPEHLPDGPNIRRITTDTLIDSESGDLVTFFDMEVYNIIGFNTLDQAAEGESEYFFIIEDNNDGTYSFTMYLNLAVDELSVMDDPGAEHEIRESFFGEDFSIKLHAEELVEGDPYVRFDATEGVIYWELPMADVLMTTSPIKLFAVYRLEVGDRAESTLPDSVEAVIPIVGDGEHSEPSELLEGVPNWVLLGLVGLCCLSLIVVVVVVVIIVIINKRKKSPSR